MPGFRTSSTRLSTLTKRALSNRSKVIVEYAYDRLPLYGAFAHLRSDDVLGRVDELLRGGTLRSSGGRFPKLRARAA